MKLVKEISRYLVAPILTIAIFAIFFELWKVDFSLPFFSYSNDALLSVFLIKGIIDNGWYFSNDFVGWPHFNESFFSHDFPVHADFFNFLIIKIFSCFSSNPFFIQNCFFIFTLAFVTFTAFIVLKNFKISDFSAGAISILYSLTHYHFARGTNHLFLSNYAIVPLIIMVGLWIMFGKKFNEKLDLKQPNYFLIALAICIFAATSGIYYALYGCIIFAMAYFLRSIEVGVFFRRDLLSVIIFCLTIIFVLFLLNIPTLNYWMEHGSNQAAMHRDYFQSEFFALKIINLLAPVENHYIEYFANIGGAFNSIALEMESTSENLGLIGAIGFLFLLFWLLVKAFSGNEKILLNYFVKKFSLTKFDQNLITKLAGLNLLIVIFATSGGLVMLMSLYFPLLRSHARFSIFIAFLALFLIAIILDKIFKNAEEKNDNLTKIGVVIVIALALLDQIGSASLKNIQNQRIKSVFNSDKNFIAEIEKNIPQGAMVFELPIVDFPEGKSYGLLRGYLHSTKINWSYPAMKNRETAIWQKWVTSLDFKELVMELKKAGFAGIYIDRNLISSESAKLKKLENYLKLTTKDLEIISQKSDLVFFKI